MLFALDTFKIVIEPGAAVGIAAVLTGQIDIRGQTVAVFTTGGNIDSRRYCELICGI
jgi:threonine dehydratase